VLIAPIEITLAFASGAIWFTRSSVFGLSASVFWYTRSQPTCLPITCPDTTAPSASSTNGSHQLALRKISWNVFDGATNVSTTRSIWFKPGPAGTPVSITASFDIADSLFFDMAGIVARAPADASENATRLP
jgi:hypothetical protein